MSVHSFDTDVAGMVGVAAAAIAQNIKFWSDHSRANGKKFYDGAYWAYNSVEAFREQFPYLSPKQIRTALDKLEAAGLIKTGVYNKDNRDRTKWYTFCSEAVVNAAICPKGQSHLPLAASPTFAQKGRPLPDGNPDSNQEIESFVDSDADDAPDEIQLGIDLYEKAAGLLKAKFGKTVWSVPRDYSPARIARLRARIESNGLTVWEDCLRKAVNSSFCVGGNKDGWTVTFDWITQLSNFNKVLEGNYDDKAPNGLPKSATASGHREPKSAFRRSHRARNDASARRADDQRDDFSGGDGIILDH